MFTRTRFQNGSNNHQGGIAERKEIIDRTHELPIVQQCQILELARSTAYYQPQPISVEDLALMRRIDALHMDWASRRVLSWRMSNTLTTDFCIEAVQEAINRYGEPEIFNTDQGCQFTSLEFTGLLKDNGIQISMDGKGCWRDNVFVRFICMLTTVSVMQGAGWGNTLPNTTSSDRTRRLTTKHRMSSTPTTCLHY
jgi:hypothetical protein